MSDNPRIYPSPNDPAIPHMPMVFEEEDITVEYKHVKRNLQTRKPLSEEELNKLGAERWDLVTVFPYQFVLHYYFKRLRPDE